VTYLVHADVEVCLCRLYASSLALSQERSCKHACQQSFAWTCNNLSDTLAPGHGGAGTAEDGDTVNAAEGTDDDAEEEDEEDDEADGTAVHAALNVSLLISAVYALPSTQKIHFPRAFIAADIWLIAAGRVSDQRTFSCFSVQHGLIATTNCGTNSYHRSLHFE